MNKRKRSLTQINTNNNQTNKRKRRAIQCIGITKKGNQCRNKCKSPNKYCYLHKKITTKPKIPEKIFIELEEHIAMMNDEQKYELCQMDCLYQVHCKIYCHDMKWYHMIYGNYNRNSIPDENITRISMNNGDWNQNYLLSAPNYPKLCGEKYIHKFYCDLVDILRYQTNDYFVQLFPTTRFLYDIHKCKRDRDNGIIFKLVPHKLNQQIVDRINSSPFNGYAPWNGYDYIRLSFIAKNENIIPKIEELTSKRDINKIVGDKITRVETTMVKLSNLLFDIIDEYSSAHQFINQCKNNHNDVENRFVSKLAAKHWKYIGAYPDRDSRLKYRRMIRRMIRYQIRAERQQRFVTCTIL